MEVITQFFKRESVKRIFFLLLLVLGCYAIKSIFNLVLLTFIITYIINSLQNVIVNYLNKFVKVNPKIITIALYLFMLICVTVTIIKYIPLLAFESISIINRIAKFRFHMPSPVLQEYLAPMLQQFEISKYAQTGINHALVMATNAGKSGLNVILAIILSLFFMLEKNNILTFVKKFEQSKISGFYHYFEHFSKNFLNSFGKVLQAQLMIAVANTILSLIGLYFLGFPSLIALGAMIFILSLIPVAGVIISFIPLSLIAFQIGGIMHIVYMIALVLIIHAIESYFLNPKFMSDKTDIPIFFTFIILIVSEHFMGVWGLLLGIPLFIFIIDLLGVNLSNKPHETSNEAITQNEHTNTKDM